MSDAPLTKCSDELLSCLEDLISVLRQLPAESALSLNAALVVRHCIANGPTRVSVLAEQLGISQPAATQIIDRLQVDGWVRRTTDTADRRGVLIAATPGGRRRFARRHALRVKSLAGSLHELGAPQQAALSAATPALRELISNLKATRNRGAA